MRLFEDIDEHNLPWLSALSRRCEQAFGDALIDLVPSYTTLLVVFDPLMVSPSQARALISRILVDLEPEDSAHAGEIHELQTWYDPSVGPELSRVAKHAGLSVNEVIDAHSQQVYRVFALGFAPGFAFMGLTDPRLECGRLDTPRRRVPPGSVAMAGRQTAAYPTATPGGWNLLGFSLLRVGDQVRFVPVSREEFEREGGDTTPMEPLA